MRRFDPSVAILFNSFTEAMKDGTSKKIVLGVVDEERDGGDVVGDEDVASVVIGELIPGASFFSSSFACLSLVVFAPAPARYPTQTSP